MDGWLEVAAKSVVYLAFAMVTGAAVVQWMLLPRTTAWLEADTRTGASRRAEHVMALAAGVLLAGVGVRAWAHTATVFGLSDSFSWDNLTLITFTSQWGRGWRVQGAAALLLAVTTLPLLGRPGLADVGRPGAGPSSGAERHRSYRLGRVVVGAAIVLVSLAIPQTGHAAGHTWRVLVHAVHLLGAGAWLGTLAVVVFGMPSPIRNDLLHAFAPVAAMSVSALIASGTAVALAYVGPLSNTWSTEYGRVLLVKLALVVAALLLGGANWRALHRPGGRAERRRTLPIVEASLVFAIVAVTAWLTETAHP